MPKLCQNCASVCRTTYKRVSLAHWSKRLPLIPFLIYRYSIFTPYFWFFTTRFPLNHTTNFSLFHFQCSLLTDYFPPTSIPSLFIVHASLLTVHFFTYSSLHIPHSSLPFFLHCYSLLPASHSLVNNSHYSILTPQFSLIVPHFSLLTFHFILLTKDGKKIHSFIAYPSLGWG